MSWGRPWKAWGGVDNVGYGGNIFTAANRLDKLEAQLNAHGLSCVRGTRDAGQPFLRILMEKQRLRQPLTFVIEYNTYNKYGKKWVVWDDWRRGGSKYKTFKGARNRLWKAIQRFEQKHKFLPRGGY